ncbi:MAG: SGNH/GDSL hydrolase family protein [bacterium]|jgi:lysophospholipase L1-like esterase
MRNNRHFLKNKLIFPVLAALIGIFLSFLLAELVLRAAGFTPIYINPLKSFHDPDPLTGWRGKRNFSARFATPAFNTRIVHDERGFRKQEFPSPEPVPKQTIFVFGDSFTWGWGVDQGEVFTDQMSLSLADSQIVNYGINGMGTVGEYLLFQQECEPLLQAQDVVLVMFYLNDFLDNIQPNGARVYADWNHGEIEMIHPKTRAHAGRLKKILSYSYLYNILSYQLNTLKKQLGEQREQIIFAQQVDLHDQHPAFQVTKHFLHEFKTACQNKQADFVLVYIPGQYELDEGEGNGDQKRQIEHSFHSAIQAITDSLDIEMLDLLPYFLEVKHEQPEVRLTLYGDAHWNALGHQYAARAIAAYLDNLRDHDIVTSE